MAAGLDKMLLKLVSNMGLNHGEAVVASSHFHSMAFWSTLPSLIALLTGNKWLALGSLPWGVTVILAEYGASGRWIDVATRGIGCLFGFALGLVLLIKGVR